jgi:hypothetical protein
MDVAPCVDGVVFPNRSIAEATGPDRPSPAETIGPSSPMHKTAQYRSAFICVDLRSSAFPFPWQSRTGGANGARQLIPRRFSAISEPLSSSALKNAVAKPAPARR